MTGLLVLSPHLDDAVLSIGRVLAGNPGATVATVFAGWPEVSRVCAFDVACGFRESRGAIRHRRREDERALGILGARPVHLDFCDRQYDRPTGDDDLAAALRRLVQDEAPQMVAGPVGLSHPDHRQLGAVWPEVIGSLGIAAYAYEELPYRVQRPRRSSAVVEEFIERHRASSHRMPLGDEGLKAKALLAYSSQLRLVAPLDCLVEERIWRLTPGLPRSASL